MNVEKMEGLVGKTLDRMAAICNEPVFDEWALVSLTDTGLSLVEYNGERYDDFLASFSEDFSALKTVFDAQLPGIGEFAFSYEGAGTGFDAFVCVGNNLFLLFNNTQKSTTEIAQSAGWKASQVAFVELCERFMQDSIDLG